MYNVTASMNKDEEVPQWEIQLEPRVCKQQYDLVACLSLMDVYDTSDTSMIGKES